MLRCVLSTDESDVSLLQVVSSAYGRTFKEVILVDAGISLRRGVYS